VVQPVNSELPGFALQHKYHSIKRYSSTNILPYKLMKPSRELIQKELSLFAKFNPYKAEVIRCILEAQAANKIHTLTPYGLNIILNPAPAHALFNQILSAAAANLDSNKPLWFVILNNLPDTAWEHLKTLFELQDPP